MEDTGYTLNQVHVLRQTFRPNEPFHAALSELITPETVRRRPFTIYGTDERIVELHDLSTRAFNAQKFDADKYMQTMHTVRLQLDNEVEARVLRTASKGAVALQLIMKPENMNEFERVRDVLDMVQVGRPTQAIGFEALRLYMNIPFDQLRPIPEVKQALAHINETLHKPETHRLYQVMPQPHIMGQFVPRASRVLMDMNNPNQPGK